MDNTIDSPASVQTEKAWVLSTSHLPSNRAFATWTQEHPRVATHRFGWVVFLVEEDAREVPEWFRPLRDLAVRDNVSFIVFDTAGTVEEFLPAYDW